MENMINIQTFLGSNLPPFLAQGMAPLTKPNSDHSRWLAKIGDDGRCDELPHDLVYAVCELDDSFDLVPIGWASLYVWNGVPSLEAFVREDWRGKRIASACAAAVLNSIGVTLEEIAVFSDECEAITKWLGCKNIVRFRRVEDGWVKSHVG